MNGVGPKVEDNLVSFVPANIGRFTTYEMGLELVGCYAQRGTYLGYPFPFSTTIRFIGGLYYKGFNFIVSHISEQKLRICILHASSLKLRTTTRWHVLDGPCFHHLG